MIKAILTFFVISFSFVCFCLCSQEYELTSLAIDGYVHDQFVPAAMNDKGHVTGRIYPYLNDQSARALFIFDERTGLREIDGYGSADELVPIAINNAQQILGGGQRPFLWGKALGFRWIEVPNGRAVEPVALNDFGQVIGRYMLGGLHSSFLWDYGVATDMGPSSEFAQQFTDLGYHVMELNLMAINNKGEVAGCFGYGRYNEKKGRYVLVGYRTFFWDGEPVVLPLDGRPDLIALNVHGQMIIQVADGMCFLWDMEGGLEGVPGFMGVSLNDRSTAFGYLAPLKHDDRSYKIPALYKHGVVLTLAELLGVDDVEKMTTPYSDTYAVERLVRFIALNNHDQILCTGEIWGDEYPCILSPKIGVNSLPPDEWEAFTSAFDSQESEKKKPRA